MYESFFRLTSRPFAAAPLVSSYFASESAEAARQTLTRLIDRAEGPGLIVGAAGVGKTLLCRLLAARFQETFQVAMLSSTRILTRKSLLQNILFELKLPYREMEEGELRLALLDHLQPNEDCPNGILLIVDEAHSLPLRLLEEIRMITNLVRDGQPRVRLILAGGAKLEEKFANPKLESFNQRIAARCYLDSFSRDETIDFVLSRISAVGGKADAIFDEGALRAIHQATDGIPRLVNQICDHALVMAFSGGRQQIDAAGIEEAWADLQQLPGPWHDTPPADTDATTIEFGELDGEPAVIEMESELVEPQDQSFDRAYEPVISLSVEGLPGDDSSLESEDIPILGDAQLSVADPFGDGFDEEEVVFDQAAIESAKIFANRTRVKSPEGRELVASMISDVELPPSEEPVLEVAVPREIEASEEDSEEEHATETLAINEVEFESQEDIPEPALVEPSPEVEEPQPSLHDWQSHSSVAAEMFEYTAFEPNAAANLALEALCDVNVALGELEGEYESPDEPIIKLVDAEVPATIDEQVDDRAIIVVESDEQPNPAAIPEATVQRVEYQTLFTQLRQG